MKFYSASISDIVLIEPTEYRDHRGFFIETFQAEKFADQGLPSNFIQDNYTGSKKGTLRGLHYQIRQPQGKLIRVVVGEVYDVAVDIRRKSPTFGQWVGIHLSTEDKKQIWIPPGFAHGFYVLSEWAEVSYKVTDFYAPEWERTILWNDPEIGIQWPLLDHQEPIMSDKDLNGKLLQDAQLFD